MSEKQEVIREVLQNLYDAAGVLTPEMVVEAARPAGSPIHSFFEWDDAQAAEEHRKAQARKLIRSVRVIYAQDNEGRDKSVRAFVSVKSPRESKPAYRPTEEVIQDPIQRAILLREFHRDWVRFRARYDHLQEFWDIVRPDQEDVG